MTHSRRSSDRARNGAGRLKILAVDDDRSYLSLIRLRLRRAGFDVQTADSGAQAIEIIRSGSEIDLLLIDLAMPEMDGIETVRRLRADMQSTLYTMLITAHDQTENKLRALDSGLDDFLPKTISEAEMVAKIRSAARRLEMERQLHLRNVELQELALTDELTGIANRRAMFSAGEALLAKGETVAAIMLDVDHFKEINDRHGHLLGDQVLAAVARCLKATTRVGDLIARYGGDEFVVLLPATGDREGRAIARRIVRGIAGLAWQLPSTDTPLRVTAAIGVSSTTRAGATDLATLLAACDTEMLLAKHARAAAPRRRRARRPAPQPEQRAE